MLVDEANGFDFHVPLIFITSYLRSDYWDILLAPSIDIPILELLYI